MIRQMLLIHESHTDVGYTHGQGRSLRWHANFIRQAMKLAETQESFRWTCETFVQVEQFWSEATDAEKQKFIQLARAGRIGLSACWANFTELPDEQLSAALLSRARRFADEHKLTLTSAMSADVNGTPRAYARALMDAGVKFMLTHVHPHHGHVPFEKRAQPFWWDLGDGRKLLVHHGEHYHLANECGLFPGASINYMVYTNPFNAFDEAELDRRLLNYMRGMESSGWPYEWITLTGAGLMTDNSPPSSLVVERIARWNRRAAAEGLPTVRMVTLDELSQVIAKDADRLPTFGGDWPDWWADGIAGDPEGTQLFRHAQRERRWLVQLTERFPQTKAALGDLTSYDLALGMFAEHTFGHSHSVSHPWNPLAQQLRLRKLAFAAEAADTAEILVEKATQPLGYGGLSCDRPLKFRVVNVANHPVRSPVELEWEGSESPRWQVEGRPVELYELISGKVIQHQAAQSMRGSALVADLTLPAGGTLDLAVRPIEKPVLSTGFKLDWSLPGRKGVYDLERDGEQAITAPLQITTDHAILTWSPTGELTGWVDRTTQKQLVRCPAEAFVLSGDRSIAPLDGKRQGECRSQMGRNRKSSDALYFSAKSLRMKKLEHGPHFDLLEVEQCMDGCELLRTQWRIWHHLPRVDVEVIVHKIGSWHAENVYCALPVGSAEAGDLWLDRGAPMRPWRDQLPGTLADFYGAQEGVVRCGKQFGVGVAMWDAHLVQCGDLRYGARKVMGDPSLPSTPDQAHAWLMTNYWETNFTAELGGFFSFRFSVGWGESLADPAAAIAWCRQATQGLRAIRLAQ